MFFGVQLQCILEANKDSLDAATYLKAKFDPLQFNKVPIKAPTLATLEISSN
jgi:hypothetical protein